MIITLYTFTVTKAVILCDGWGRIQTPSRQAEFAAYDPLVAAWVIRR